MPYPYYNASMPASGLYGSNYASAPYNYAPSGQSVSQANLGAIQWVQGESGAKSFPVGANSTALLMDSETQKFYIKTVDASGMPQPLRSFRYEEIKEVATSPAPAKPNVEYVTKAEFEKAIAELSATRKVEKKDEQSAL